MPTMTLNDWRRRGALLYGGDQSKWRFRCPVCGHVATPADWEKVGAPASAVAFACIGGWMRQRRKAFGSAGEPGPCDYSGGGLFAMNPIEVIGVDAQGRPRTVQMFEFADESPVIEP